MRQYLKLEDNLKYLSSFLYRTILCHLQVPTSLLAIQTLTRAEVYWWDDQTRRHSAS